ncbi:DNA cytosine methyltransferase [Ligilactobacillus salivarius]|uniref:DNA (cytosine-5-)-methyltransferase n=1 Tax=Ligilactobacillus salivarius TaxID=1624 RepID=A0A9X6S2N2_9LACO|nr:DNA cytosine methyltransferase [Ligilactobacillus salivarius]PAY25153.1 DNA methyltransferase [Ligilactobacillus salivarius]PAY27961.1 DNA methyltransferase [Ligilactobacillus salivarius]PAY30890.1 DNA methyltransferase [Ligilactobacillus salivarius]PAY34596.1 DNA methyltransferase [Ligilactobacillus salivarius]PAY37771.1 DNA methyltransferase [Ligilactobacillus salivarius]
MANTGYSILETFVGAGGSHLGFMMENYRTVYVNDFVDECLETLKYNNENLIEEGAIFDDTPIEKLNPVTIRQKTNMDVGELDVMFGGVVCKGFSLAGDRSPNDPRNTLYRRQLDLVKEFMPKISIVENVPGIINAKILSNDVPLEIKKDVDELWGKLARYKGEKANLRKQNRLTEDFENLGNSLKKQKKHLLQKLEKSGYLISVLEDLKRIYSTIGYRVQHKVLNSAWYGAATKRERVIIVATRNDIDIKFHYPQPQYMDSKIMKKGMEKYIGLPNPRTVNDALNTIDYEGMNSEENDADNIPMKHKDKTVRRFRFIPEGDSIANHINELPDDLKISKFYSRGSTMRLAGNEPSPTLVPGHSNFPVHPRKDRSITVREAATITGFPLNYKFFGSHSKRCEHVGNAVPPALAQAIAKECTIFLDKYYKK